MERLCISYGSQCKHQRDQFSVLELLDVWTDIRDRQETQAITVVLMILVRTLTGLNPLLGLREPSTRPETRLRNKGAARFILKIERCLQEMPYYTCCLPILTILGKVSK